MLETIFGFLSLAFYVLLLFAWVFLCVVHDNSPTLQRHLDLCEELKGLGCLGIFSLGAIATGATFIEWYMGLAISIGTIVVVLLITAAVRGGRYVAKYLERDK